MKKCLAFLLSTIFTLSMLAPPLSVQAEETSPEPVTDSAPAGAASPGNTTDLGIQSPGAILMEAYTGTILYEQGSHTQLRPASVTKIMTILLAYEAVQQGRATLDDMVTVSKNAAGYGGSTILLEEGEQISLRNLIKGMCIASGNDAAIATAEYIGGSQDGFVQLMNQRAAELGMKDTHFINPCGLDADGHVTSAHDIAIMSRQLIVNFPEVTEYTTTWHEMMPHQWKKGPGETDMANTNKLIQSYEGMTGLKTGYTRLARYSLSATATRGNLSLIAVIMGADTKEIRSSEITALLNYGFGNYDFLRLNTNGQHIDDLPLSGSNLTALSVQIGGDVNVLTKKGTAINSDALRSEIVYHDALPLPIKAGDTVGEIIYHDGDTEIARLPLVAGADADKATFGQVVIQLMRPLLGVSPDTASESQSPADSGAPPDLTEPSESDQTQEPADESLPESSQPSL